MNNFTIVIPCDESRTELMFKTLMRYCVLLDNFEYKNNVEILVVSRSIEKLDFVLPRLLPIKLIKYKLQGEGFSQSNALNLGIQNANYTNIIVTSPEVMPRTNVLKQLSELPRGNYICQVFDQAINGDESFSLVNNRFRNETPAMHFLGCFKKEDLEYINGWSLDYQRGNGYFNDDDFGDRFNKAGLKFEIKEEIQAVHQYHPRGGYDDECRINHTIFNAQKQSSRYYAERGLRETKVE